MSFIEQTITKSVVLEYLIHNAILGSVQNSAILSHSIGKRPEEPDFIAGLVIDFVPDLFNILKSMYTGIDFSLTGIFSHQKPIVKTGKKKSCELGDILFVHIHNDKKGKILYNSLLFQAKISQTRSKIIPKAEFHQLDLYENWPEFTYSKAGKSLNGQKRSVQPKKQHDGAQYMLIDDSPFGLLGVSGTFPIGCAVANTNLVLDRRLSEELVDFLKFKSGRPFEKENINNDPWSIIIWDLINLSKLAISKRKNSNRPRFSRTQSLDFVSSGTSSSLFSDVLRNLKNVEQPIDEGEWASVSAVVIESAEVQ